MSAARKAAGFVAGLPRAWAVGMLKLITNDLHPSPAARAGVMIAVLIVGLSVVHFLPGLVAGAKLAWAVVGALVLALGWLSYWVNHSLRGAFF